jgi:hypothetical protein
MITNDLYLYKHVLSDMGIKKKKIKDQNLNT